MGSYAYGVSNDSSDVDIYGFSIPYKGLVFPHLEGYIEGFGKKPQGFNQYQEHHIKSKCGNHEYDLAIYSIVQYFNLCMQCNPNMIDSLFTPINCVKFSTNIGSYVREHRDMFLSKKGWHTFKGYAFSQVHKMNSKQERIGKRKELVDKYGYDVKFAYHVVRLLNEIEMIMEEGTLDLQRSKEQLKAVRNGEWSQKGITDWFTSKEIELEKLYRSSKLRHAPDASAIKQVLLNCLEMHFGSLDKAVAKDRSADQLIGELSQLINKWRSE